MVDACLAFSVLGSGSLGNCTVIERVGASPMLIDCGLSPRATGRRLAPLGLVLDDITDIYLTHLDHDHFAPGWVKRLTTYPITVHVHTRHRARAVRMGVPGRRLALFDQAHTRADGTHVEPVLLAHDGLGSVGYVIEHADTRFALATDLGRVSSTVLDRFVDLDGLALESNYDRTLQLTSDRPPILKRRIMGGRGHLCNTEALEAILHIESQSQLAHVALLHLSRQCNHPEIIRRLYAHRAPHLLPRLTITSQATPSARRALRRGRRARPRQLVLF